MQKGDLPADPRGLIFEAYRMDLDAKDCRTVFFDWAVGLDAAVRPELVRLLLEHYGPAHADHPMTAVLREGLEEAPPPSGRRGGWRGRRRE